MNKFMVDFNGVLILEAYTVTEHVNIVEDSTVYNLSIRFYDNSGDVEYYKNLFSTDEKMFDVITVTDSSGNKTVLEGYTNMISLYRALRDGGLPSEGLELQKPVIVLQENSISDTNPLPSTPGATRLDVVEAQSVYTAMMTDTLLEA